MKIAEFDRLQHITIKEEKLPNLNSNEVLIKSIASGICGSEVHAYLGTHPFREPPSIMGHESLGQIVSIGGNCKGFQIGDYVVVEPQIGCENCTQCKNGDYNLCANKVVLGTTKWPGAFAEYFKAPSQCLHKVEGEYDLHYILAEPLAVGCHAVRKAAVKKEDNVIVIGGGPIGILTALAAKEAGATNIFVTDLVELNLNVIQHLGVGQAVNTLRTSLASVVEELDIHHIFITIGIAPVVQEACQLIAPKGRITSIALYEKPVPINLNELMIKEIEFVGSSMYVKEDFTKAMKIIQEKKYDFSKLITKQYPFEETYAAMEDSVHLSKETIKTIITF